MRRAGDGQAWRRLRFYAGYGWRFLVLRRPDPLIYGIAPTDRCNLACRGCRVANTGRPDMGWSRLVAAMADARRRGFRELHFSGGESMLWADDDRTIHDAIAEARRLGFFHVHVYYFALDYVNTLWTEARRQPWPLQVAP